MLDDHHISLLALCRIKGLSWHLVAREVLRPEGLDRLLIGEVSEASAEATEAKAVLAADLPHLDRHRDEVRKTVERALADEIRLTTVLDADFPLNLRTIFNPPVFLFYRGQLSEREDARSVCVVGTREASDDGLKRARKMARLLAENGVTVLSGLARGVDTAAHQATLEAGGRTVAVVGTGIRRVYPPENDALARQIATSGAVVSQFWPETPPARYTFPRRNVTMSGISQGTVVIEASSTSGAKMQARLALEHGRKVFLVKTLVTSQTWARTYLSRGALEVERVEDVLAWLRSADQLKVRTTAVHQLRLGLD